MNVWTEISKILKHFESDLAGLIEEEIEKEKKESYKEGYDKGHDEGYDKGYNDGEQEGIRKAKEEFYKKEKVNFT